MRILLIDDDLENIECMTTEISDHFLVDVAYNGADGCFLSQVNDYATIVVDYELPDIHSQDFCRITRKANVSTPILMTIKEDDPDIKVACLDCGVNGFLKKPVYANELVAYIHSFTKQKYGLNHISKLVINDLVLDTKTKEVFKNGTKINLRRKEFDILEILMTRKNNVVSKEFLLEQVWEEGICVGSNTLEVHIKSLRDKIDKPFDKKLIKTVYGFGYKLASRG